LFLEIVEIINMNEVKDFKTLADKILYYDWQCRFSNFF